MQNALAIALPGGLQVLPYGMAEDSDAFVVTRETAEKYGLTSLADLKKQNGKLVIGAAPEVKKRAVGVGRPEGRVRRRVQGVQVPRLLRPAGQGRPEEGRRRRGEPLHHRHRHRGQRLGGARPTPRTSSPASTSSPSSPTARPTPRSARPWPASATSSPPSSSPSSTAWSTRTRRTRTGGGRLGEAAEAGLRRAAARLTRASGRRAGAAGRTAGTALRCRGRS